jgi:alpha-tubulin suppressor-like RCC1 family protein
MRFKMLIVIASAVLTTGTVEAGVVDEVSAGENTSCFRTGTDLYCYGDNTYHQVSSGVATRVLSPSLMGRWYRDRSGREGFEAYRVETVSVGRQHVCAVFTDHKAYCWGHNTYGQLGDNSLTDASTPSQVAMPFDVTAVLSISSGTNHTCAIVVRNGRKRALCWGQNNRGQLAGPGAFSAVPRQYGNLPVESIHTGGEFTCALGGADVGGFESYYGRLYCWGANSEGQLGDGFAGPDVYQPTPITLPVAPPYTDAYDSRARSVATGKNFMCAVITAKNPYNGDRPYATGSVYCVGDNRFSATQPQFSAGGSAPVVVTSWFLQPVPSNGAVLVASSSTAKHACAVIYNGDVWCWGANADGQLGRGFAKPVPPAANDGALPDAAWFLTGLVCQENTGQGGGYNSGTPCPRGISVGGAHTMAITTSKAVYAWGRGWRGQLGLGDLDNRLVPTAIGY